MITSDSHPWLQLAIQCREQAKSASGALCRILRAEMRGAALQATRKP